MDKLYSNVIPVASTREAQEMAGEPFYPQYGIRGTKKPTDDVDTSQLINDAYNALEALSNAQIPSNILVRAQDLMDALRQMK